MNSTVIASINQKGGVGKTTTAVNLSQALTGKKSRVLLLDLDSQANASMHVGVTDPQAGESFLRAILQPTKCRLESLIYETEFGFDLIANSSLFASADEFIRSESVVPQTMLQDFIHELKKQCGAEWKYIILDCPRAISMVSVNALVASDYALIPVQSNVFSLEGLKEILTTITKIQQKLNPKLKYGVLGGMHDARTRISDEMLDRIEEAFPDILFDTRISDTVKIKEAPGYGKPIAAYEPRSKVVTEYQNLAKELRRRLEL
jgi:chromosome partitioning protein